MPKKTWGRKIVCQSCSAKFYDLNRKPGDIVCPVCGAEYVNDTNINTNVTSAKQVFKDDVDTASDNNLVQSDISESMVEVEEIENEDLMDDDDTISLDDAETEDSVMPEDDEDIGIAESDPEELNNQ